MNHTLVLSSSGSKAQVVISYFSHKYDAFVLRKNRFMYYYWGEIFVSQRDLGFERKLYSLKEL